MLTRRLVCVCFAVRESGMFVMQVFVDILQELMAEGHAASKALFSNAFQPALPFLKNLLEKSFTYPGACTLVPPHLALTHVHHSHMHTHRYIHLHAYIHARACSHTHMQTCTHTHTHTLSLSLLSSNSHNLLTLVLILWIFTHDPCSVCVCVCVCIWNFLCRSPHCGNSVDSSFAADVERPTTAHCNIHVCAYVRMCVCVYVYICVRVCFVYCV
jgi:hypothetical protein